MRSAAEFERDAEAARRGLSSTLDDLRESATPGNLTREAMYLAKDSGVSILRALADTARNHPIPALMIGAGLVMMMTENRDGGTGNGTTGSDLLQKAGAAIKEVTQGGARAVRSAVQGVGSVAGSAVSAVKESASAVKGTADSAISAVRDTAASAADKIGDAAGQVKSAAGSASELTGHTAEQAEALANQAKGAIAKLIDEQPLVAAALGVALGAAIGAALPATAAEREYLGKASAKVRRAGQDILSKVTEAASAEADAQGLGRDAIKEVVEGVGEKVRTVAEKAVETLSQQVEPQRRTAGADRSA